MATDIHVSRAYGQILFTGTGDWNDFINWNTEELPTSATEVRIGNADTGAIASISVAPNAESGVAHIGFDVGEIGTVNVGNAIQWAISGALNVGNLGDGTLNIENGSQVASTGTTTVALGLGSTGAVTVTGTGTLWQATYLAVAQNGNGTLTVSNGAKVTSSKSSYIGAGSTTNHDVVGEATVTGAGSRWEATENFQIGQYAKGTLTVSAGGVVTAGVGTSSARAAYIASQTDSEGHVTVTGAGSSFAMTGEFGLGERGKGTLTISDGGTVTAATLSNSTTRYYVRIGRYAGSEGEMIVTGPGSSFTTTGDIELGSGGKGTLTISNGGTVTTNPISGVTITTYIGRNAGSEGHATVTGANSLLQTQNFAVGQNGLGTLEISNGGKIMATGNSYIAGGVTGPGEVTVTGTNSLWQTTGALDVGQNAIGTLTIADGGRVVVGSQINFGRGSATGQGTVNLNGSEENGRGVLQIGRFLSVTGAGTGVINFDGGILRAGAAYTAPDLMYNMTQAYVKEGGAFVDTNGFDRTLSQALQHGGTAATDGGLTKQGAGVLTLAGVNTYIGLTTVEAGELRVAGSLGSAATVKAASTLSGTGSILGAVTVENGGILAPGLGLNAPGELEIGELTLTSGSALSLQIHGNLFDDNSSLLVNGAVNLGGSTLSLTGDLWALPEDMAEVRLFLLINNGVSAINGTFAGLAEGATVSFAGQDYQITYQANFVEADSPLNSLTGGNDVALLAVPASVPEPGSTGLLLGGVALLGSLRRRRKAA